MASFNKPIIVVPNKIGTVQVIITDGVQDTSSIGTVVGLSTQFSIKRLDANNNVIDVIQGDLMDKLTPAHVTALTNFMTAVRTKAGAETI